MKRSLLLTLLMAWMTMGSHAITITDTIFNRYEHEDFAFGADVSFVPMMESWGTKWLDKTGKQKDILQILKEQGVNNIRLRVWTVASCSCRGSKSIRCSCAHPTNGSSKHKINRNLWYFICVISKKRHKDT